MTAAAVPLAPPARALAAWWRLLGPLRPLRLWFADWLVHRLDVLTTVERSAKLDSLTRFLLDILSSGPVPNPASLAVRLGLDPALVARMLAELARERLAHFEAGWSITDTGHAALVAGAFPRLFPERRLFCIVADPLVFLPSAVHGTPVTMIDPPPAPLDALHAAVARPAEWKHAAGFPDDVRAIIDMTSPVRISPSWRNVPLDRPERIIAALVLLPDGCVQGFETRPETWSLSPDTLLNIRPEAAPPLPDPGEDAWSRALRHWSPDLHDVTIGHSESDLTISIDSTRATSLRARHPELARGEAWLLAGEGSTRLAKRVVINPG